MSTADSELVLTMTERAPSGDCFAIVDDKKLFVAGTLQGEKVRIRRGIEHPTYIEGELLEILSPSALRVSSFCEYHCGGCSYTNVAYDTELKAKKNGLKSLFADTEYADLVFQCDIHGMKEPFGYRNKAIYACTIRDGVLISGLYARGSHEIVTIPDCAIEAHWIAETRRRVTAFFQEHRGESAKNLRYIFLRGDDDSEKMCVLVMRKHQNPDLFQELVKLNETLHMDSLQININDTDGNRVLGDEFIEVCGNRSIQVNLLGLSFRINAESFLQINAKQAVVLYKRALEILTPQANDVLVDLYCGAGTISLYAASLVKKVIGIECVSAAIEDAKNNAKLNGIDNVEFRCGLVEKVFPELIAEGGKIDCAVLDPSRRGCDPKVFDTLAKYGVQRFVYISCNPVTQKRDLLYAKTLGYSMVQFEAVDMFPHTEHVETVCLLSKKP